MKSYFCFILIIMDTLPLRVQNYFQSAIDRQNRKYSVVKRVHDKDNNITYFIYEFKDDPEISYLDYVNNEFIPNHNYDDPCLVLRTDFDNRDANYASTAWSLYAGKYVVNRELHQEMLSYNPNEDGKVDIEIEI